jgi:hypothetical protein
MKTELLAQHGAVQLIADRPAAADHAAVSVERAEHDHFPLILRGNAGNQFALVAVFL